MTELDGEKIGCISAVRYGTFGFIGFFIVRPQWRGKGYGRALWERVLRHLGDIPIGLDGVPAQQENYKLSGFRYAYANVRYQCDVREPRDRFSSAIELAPLRVADDELFAYDRACFGAERRAFLQPWIVQPDVVALTARSLHGGELIGYGVGRVCREGTKIGPLFASRLDVAAILFDTIAGRTRSPWFLDVPAPNVAAVGFADERRMKPVFETARMWRGPAPQIDLEKVYGVTSFELG